jgi:hypothetical protein
MRVHPVNHRPRSAGVSKYGNIDRAWLASSTFSASGG